MIHITPSFKKLRLLFSALVAAACCCAIPAIAQSDKGSITFAFAGDIMQGTTFPEDGVSYLPSNDGKDLFKDVTEILSQADIAAANNEGTLLDRGGTVKRCGDPKLCYAFRTPTSYTSNLVNAGIDFMSIANNHINDSVPKVYAPPKTPCARQA